MSVRCVVCNEAFHPPGTRCYQSLRDNVTSLKAALEGLRVNEECWCQVAIGNPMMRGHSDACKTVQELLEP